MHPHRHHQPDRPLLVACPPQAFAFYQGVHQDMLDAMVYYISFMVTAATAVSMLAEMIDPEAFWMGCVKVYTLWMQVRLSP